MFKVTYRFHGSIDTEVLTFVSYEAAQEWIDGREDDFANFKLENTAKH